MSLCIRLRLKPGERGSTDQTLLVARLAGVTDVHPQGLLTQCAVRYLHAEHLVDLGDVLWQGAACSEEAARGLHTGQHHNPHIPAGHTGTGVTGAAWSHDLISVHCFMSAFEHPLDSG